MYNTHSRFTLTCFGTTVAPIVQQQWPAVTYCKKRRAGLPVSRILSSASVTGCNVVIICLASPLLMRSSSLPGSFVTDNTLPCLALHPAGFTLPRSVTRTGGELLPRLFTLTPENPKRFVFCGTFHLSHSESPRISRGTASVGVRTFLSHRPLQRVKAITRQSCPSLINAKNV